MPEQTAEELAAAEAAATAAAEEAAKAAELADKAPTSEDVAKLQEVARKERDARKAAEKGAKEGADAIKRLAEIEAANLTETERLKKEAEEARDALNATTSKVRAANLKVALGDSRYGLASAKAAATLLQAEGVEFDENDEPIGLDEAVTALVDANPFLTGEKPKPKAPNTNGGSGSGAVAPVVELTAEELDMAKSFGLTPEKYAANKDVNPPATAAT
jgi:hypothetical protein